MAGAAMCRSGSLVSTPRNSEKPPRVFGGLCCELFRVLIAHCGKGANDPGQPAWFIPV
jgi:hypothetical protein